MASHSWKLIKRLFMSLYGVISLLLFLSGIILELFGQESLEAFLSNIGLKQFEQIISLAPWLIALGFVFWEILRINHEQLTRIESTLDIVFHAPDSPYLQAVYDMPGHPEVARSKLFRIGVHNAGIDTVEGVRVMLETIEPPVSHIRCLPIWLHCMNDNPLENRERPFETEFQLNGDETIHFDVIRQRAGLQVTGPRAVQPTPEQPHLTPAVLDLRDSLTIPFERHELTILATGRDMAACRKRFTVTFDEHGGLLFEEAA